MRRYIALATILLVGSAACTPSHTRQETGERWVCTWATAQELAPMKFPTGPGADGPPPLQGSFRQQATPRQSTNSLQPRRPGDSPIMFNMPSNLHDQTVRMIIRTSGFFDAVVDFDAVIRDPSRPVRMRSEYDPGDHIHPNDAGNQAMADALDLKLFRN